MTNERNRPDANGLHDASVSRAYADLATERAPAQLDQAVLRKAQKAAERPYRRSILWTRPVAWAAVVAICLAITLQVTQVPVPDDIADIGLVERDDSTASPVASDAPAAATEESSAARRSDGVEKASQPAVPLEAKQQEASSPVPEIFEMQDADMLQRAEDMARQRAGENKEAEHVARGVSSYAPASAAASLRLAVCTEDDRNEPQTWLDCIALLEEAGLQDAAAAERELLAEAFPDFAAPATTE